jgi:dihydrofolate reductase
MAATASARGITRAELKGRLLLKPLSCPAKRNRRTISLTADGGEEAALKKLIYSMGVSLDGFIAGPDGNFDWSAPDEELHRFHNQQTAELGAHLLGRRLYETMVYWETADQHLSDDYRMEFARIWQALPKVVFSSTLEEVEGNARLARGGVAEEVARLKQEPGKDLGVGGAGLASTCAQLGLIDEYRLFLNPVIAGGGTPFFPPLERRADLELVETRTFGSRVVYARYRAVASAQGR